MKVHFDTYDSLSKHDNVLNVLQQIIIFKGNCKKTLHKTSFINFDVCYLPRDSIRHMFVLIE